MTLNPRRVQRSRAAGYRMPPQTKSVCRPGPFGNPFIIGKDVVDAAAAVAQYRIWLDETPEGQAIAQRARTFLRGWNLACFCALDQPCHADVLLKIANE